MDVVSEGGLMLPGAECAGSKPSEGVLVSRGYN